MTFAIPFPLEAEADKVDIPSPLLFIMEPWPTYVSGMFLFAEFATFYIYFTANIIVYLQ